MTIRKNKDGINILFEEYLPFFLEKSTWKLSFFISSIISLYMFFNKVKVFSIIDNISDIGLRIFPTTLSLSLAIITFMIGKTLTKERFDSLHKLNIKDIKFMDYAIMVFMFFVALNGIGLLFFLIVKLGINIYINSPIEYINYVKRWVNILKYILLLGIIFYLFLVVLTIIDMISNIYTLFVASRLSEKNEE